MAKRFFQGGNLRANSWLRKAQSLASSGDAAFSCHNPKIEQVVVVQPFHVEPQWSVAFLNRENRLYLFATHTYLVGKSVVETGAPGRSVCQVTNLYYTPSNSMF